jgi:hypothetical protein
MKNVALQKMATELKMEEKTCFSYKIKVLYLNLVKLLENLKILNFQRNLNTKLKKFSILNQNKTIIFDFWQYVYLWKLKN